MKVIIKKEDLNLLDFGTQIQFENETWSYLPFWFKRLPDGSAEMVLFKDMPPAIKHQILNLRETRPNFNETSQHIYPITPKDEN